MTRRRILLLVLAGLVAAAAIAAFLLRRNGVAEARRRWEAKVEALRAAGEPIDPDDFRVEPVPDADNAEGLLREVHEAYDAAWPEWPGPAAYPMDYVSDEFSEEELEALADAWPRLEPLYARLAEASARPVLLATSSDPFDVHIVPWIQDAGRLWMLRARYRPEDAERMAVQNLKTALAWRPRNNVDVFVRWGHVVHAVSILREALLSGHADVAEDGPALRKMLRQAEEGWLEDFRLALRAARTSVVLEVAILSGDRAPPEGTQELYDRVRPDGAAALEKVYVEALAKLDHLDTELAAVQSEEDLRGAPIPAEADAGGPAYRHSIRRAVVKILVGVRLARWALLLAEEKAAGRALFDDLAAYADRFPGGPPLDPTTGRPFRWQRREVGFLLSVDVDAADLVYLPLDRYRYDGEHAVEMMVDEGLAWIIADV